MTLEEKMDSISTDFPSIFHDHFNGNAATIEDFWNQFISPRLPPRESVLAWHDILMDYVNRPNALFAFRAFSSDKPKGSIRRGLYCTTNDDYSFFFADNSFAYYILRCVYDGDCNPTPDEFYTFMVNRQMPYKMSFGSTQTENEYADAFKVGGNPHVADCYKVAHLYDAGRRYCWNSKNLQRRPIAKAYFSRGTLNRWEQVTETNRQKYTRNPDRIYHVRSFVYNEEDKMEAKCLMVAQFLRFVHPMNYFLAPKAAYKIGKPEQRVYHRYIGNDNQEDYDIAEYGPLLRFVKHKFHEIYSVNGRDYYQEFLNSIYPFIDETEETGANRIDIEYSSEPLNNVVAPHVETHRQVSRYAANRQEVTPRTRTPRGEGPTIELVPNDLAQFKAALLRSHTARRTWFFANGEERPDEWDASNMNEHSNVLGNIRSTSIFKRWRENGLERVRIVVEE